MATEKTGRQGVGSFAKEENETISKHSIDQIL